MKMDTQRLLVVLMSLAVTLPLQAQADGAIEPNAGNWQTWVISSGSDYRVPPPPGAAETTAAAATLLLNCLRSMCWSPPMRKRAFYASGDYDGR